MMLNVKVLDEIEVFLRHEFYNQITKEASQTVLRHVSLPEGIIQSGRENAVQDAYDTLSMAHRLTRTKIYLELAGLVYKTHISSRLYFYARHELLTVHSWLKKLNKDDNFVRFLEEEFAKLKNETEVPPPINILLKNEPLAGSHAVLVTDLYRDYDDWLTLLHLIISGKYEKISIVSSNEIFGECAQITESFIPHLKTLAKILHGRDISIELFEGLPAFDFAPFHSEYKEKHFGIHFPEKAYAASMRMPVSKQVQKVKKYQDLLNVIPTWQKNSVDVISIGKIADLDILLLLADSCGFVFNKLTVLGCRPQSSSTNTNGFAFHLQSLPDETIMLDSRYGKDPEFGIFKENFAELFDINSKNLSSSTFARSLSNSFKSIDNPVEKHIKELLLELALLSENLKPEERNSINILIISTLAHIKNLHYSRGSTYDLFTLFAEKIHLSSKEIYFSVQKDKPEKAQCYFENPLLDTTQTIVKNVKVRYPDRESIQVNFINYLKELTQSIQQKIKEQKIMHFNLEQLHEKFPLLDHYGKFGDDVSTRASKTLTRMDEYKLIVRSLMILNVLADNGLSDEETAKEIAGGFPTSEFGFDPLTKPQNMVPNISYLRSLLKQLDVKDIMLCYVIHDLGKCESFVTANKLTKENEIPKAAAHDDYLDTYLSQRSALAALFNNKENALFVKILDLLGHNPNQLQPVAPFPSLKMVADIALSVKDFAEEVKVKQVPAQVATRKAINSLLCNKAKSLNMDTTTIKSIDPNNSYHQLSTEQQNELAFLMWTGGLRIMQSGDSLESFKAAWHDPKNADVVSKMVSLLMNNLEQSDGFCMLYNPTGLLHKTDVNLKLKAFLGAKDKGGMGANMEEVVTVAFPFILERCEDNDFRRTSTVGHNDFQAQQLVEIVQNLYPHLGEISTGKNVYPHVDFGTPEMNNKLEMYLDAIRANALSRRVVLN